MSNEPLILLVEDEVNLGSSLKEYLEIKNFKVTWADSVKTAKEEFYKNSYKIVLMDIGLPDGNGLELAQEFRNSRKDFVLLFLSALNDPNTRLEGLEIGAEDYITKPFELKELIIRLNRILNAMSDNDKNSNEIAIGGLKISFSKYELTDANNKIINMSQKECAILRMLYASVDQVVSRDKIIDNVWGQDAFPSNRTVDNYIVKLRKWCETDPEEKVTIESIRGIGYKLKVNNNG